MGDRETRKQQVHERILREARRLFVDQGVEQATVEDIALAAGVSRATLFNYFRGKPAILDALAAGMEPRLVDVVSHYASQQTSTREQLLQLFTHSARVVSGSGTLNRELFVCASKGLVMTRLQNALEDMLDAGQRRGDVAPDTNLPLLAHNIYLALLATIMGWDIAGKMSVAEQAELRIAWLCDHCLV